MLKGIDPILTPELLMRLASMGHGEWVAVVDANFTAEYLASGKPVIRLPGLSLERVSQAVLSIFPLADDVDAPVGYMQVSGSEPGHQTPAQQAVVRLAGQHGLAAKRVAGIERYAFYEQVKRASLIVQTGEGSAYGNALFCKGVIFF